jgi:hypothetical protein
MPSVRNTFAVLAAASFAAAIPVQHPIPGFSNYFSNYRGKAPPYPGNETAPIMPTTNGTAGPDDLLY